MKQTAPGVLALVVPVERRIGHSLVRVPVIDDDVDHGVAAALLGGQVQGYRWPLHAPRRQRRSGSTGPGYCWLYLLVDRQLRRMPVNERAVEIGRCLGHLNEAEHLLGPALVIGAGRGGGPTDVPHQVSGAARGLIP